MMRTKPTVAVIGAGPCGVAAAVQVHRNDLPVMLFEGRAVGGLLHNAHRVENYPGIPSGLAGENFCRRLERHLEASGVSPVFDTVTCLTPGDRGYLLRTASGRCHHAAAVIVATGTVPNRIELPWITKEASDKVFQEVRDLPGDLRGRRAAVIGAGDAAYDYALSLHDRGCAVAILQRSEPCCLPLLARRVHERKTIALVKNSRIAACAENEGGLEIVFEDSDSRPMLSVDFVVVACGRSPEDRLLATLPDLDIDGGCLLGTRGLGQETEGIGQETNGLGQETKGFRRNTKGFLRKTTGIRQAPGPEGSPWPGIFAGGDLVSGQNRQAGIAVGHGLVAAMQAVRYIGRIAHR